jgi:hypothetical protein
VPRADRSAEPTEPTAVPEASAPVEAPTAAQAASPEIPKQTVYRVAPGKTIATRMGALDEGAVIRASDVDGDKHLAELVDAGAVVKS